MALEAHKKALILVNDMHNFPPSDEVVKLSAYECHVKLASGCYSRPNGNILIAFLFITHRQND